jgi:hypothetical protein
MDEVNFEKKMLPSCNYVEQLPVDIALNHLHMQMANTQNGQTPFTRNQYTNYTARLPACLPVCCLCHTFTAEG